MNEQYKILEKWLWRYNGKVDETGRLHLNCLCDGTAVFLGNMVYILKQLRCSDIETKCRTVGKDETPPGKPWCNCLFEASGVLPKDLVVKTKNQDE